MTKKTLQELQRFLATKGVTSVEVRQDPIHVSHGCGGSIRRGYSATIKTVSDEVSCCKRESLWEAMHGAIKAVEALGHPDKLLLQMETKK